MHIRLSNTPSIFKLEYGLGIGSSAVQSQNTSHIDKKSSVYVAGFPTDISEVDIGIPFLPSE